MRLLWIIVFLTSLPFRPLGVSRLKDMTVPRADHVLFSPDGETLVVAGGHTTGFLPTNDAEHLHKGKWASSTSLYQHDAPFLVKASDGRYLIGGGYSNYLGVGQSVVMEFYDPASGGFFPGKIMERKRARASAIELSAREILISGNWYADDLTEIWTEENGTVKTLPVSQHRADPYLLRCSAEDALIFSPWDIHGDPLEPIIVDRLSGDSFTPAVFDSLRPLTLHMEPDVQHNYIGITDSGLPSYLIAAKNKEGQVYIIRTEGDQFHLAGLQEPVPFNGPWGRIYWEGLVYVCQKTQCGFLTGRDSDGRFYLLCLDGSGGWEHPDVSTYVSNPLPELGNGPKILLDGGRMILAGGVFGEQHNNYSPLPTCWELYLPDREPLATARQKPLWLVWIVLSGILLGALAWAVSGLRKRKKADTDPRAPAASDESTPENVLYRQIVALMQEDQLFRKKNLKMSDVASTLGTNTRYVSAAINAQKTSFVDFVNGYRVRYAMELLRNGKISLGEIADESGFASEVSFFRNFKKVTGKSPSAWLQT